MNPGDTITIHMYDAPAPGGGKAFEVVIDDLTTAHERLHAGLGRQRLPEHLDRQLRRARRSTSSRSTRPRRRAQHHPVGRAADEHQHRVRDRALRAVHLAERPAQPQPARPVRHRRRPTTSAAARTRALPARTARAPRRATRCATRRATPTRLRRAGTTTQPDEMTGCQDNFFQNGDLDFDGSPVLAGVADGHDRRTSYPSTLRRAVPTTVRRGSTRSTSSRPTSRCASRLHRDHA